MTDTRVQRSDGLGAIDLVFSLEGSWNTTGARVEQRDGRVCATVFGNPNGAATENIRAQLKRPCTWMSMVLTSSRLRKAEHLRAVARATADGWIATPRLRKMAHDEAMSHLQQVPGIGPFSAELILPRGPGDPDAFPRLGSASTMRWLRHTNLARSLPSTG